MKRERATASGVDVAVGEAARVGVLVWVAGATPPGAVTAVASVGVLVGGTGVRAGVRAAVLATVDVAIGCVKRRSWLPARVASTAVRSTAAHTARRRLHVRMGGGNDALIAA